MVGFELNLEIRKVLIPDTKLAETCQLLQCLVERPLISARMLASAIGKIVFMSLALGSVAGLMTRNLYVKL